jgi:predicted short-subunit dehydrogenase-like oxidoreductase (DUF2520 family)
MKACIIGAGRVAWSLIPALQEAGVEVVQLISRNQKQLDTFSQSYSLPNNTTKLASLRQDIDLIFLTIPDSSIQSFTYSLLPFTSNKAILLHTSGSVSIEALSAWNGPKGVFYPMQTFTLEKRTAYDDVPLFLEGNETILSILKPLATRMSRRVQILDSPSRAKLHLGAVMVCNFTNLLYTYADELIPEVDINAYEPLIRGHLKNVFSLGPRASQTGPAARGDFSTIQRHIDLLKNKPEAQDLYRIMSELISQEKLRNEEIKN